MVTVGVLSDTHGHLCNEVAGALEGVDHIIHAGDVGSPRVLDALRSIAPVTAVRGNCDYETWAQSLPIHAEVLLGSARVLVGHIAAHMAGRAEATARSVVAAAQSGGSVPAADGRSYQVVITGHTHAALIEKRDGVLYVNPGSAGPRRFGRPRSLALLTIQSTRTSDGGIRVNADARVVELDGD